MNKTRLMVIGGFLGAGKTTSIIAIAKQLLSAGKKIGIVTNDQGSQLVDSQFMAQQGLPVLEVTGGCFCCNFDEFTRKLSQISDEYFPDVVIAEPVGSCTDLIATIMKPIKKGYAGKFALSPLSIVVDPKRLKRVMKDDKKLFQNDINYLFEKQIQEADVIVLNKIDTLTEEEIKEYTNFLKEKFPQSQVIAISSTSGTGIENWIEQISSACDFTKKSLDIEYETYASAEAALGWLNTTAGINPLTSLDANAFVYDFSETIKSVFKEKSKEIAHLKLYLVSSMDFCKLSCVSVFEDSIFDKKMALNCTECSLVINIRAECPPDFLQALTENTLKELAKKHQFDLLELQTDCFSPSYPNPAHRI